MNQFRVVPGAPYFRWEHADFPWDRHFLFSYARHAMIEFLRFTKIRNNYPVLRLLSPRYMCHEVIKSLGEHVQEITYYNQREDFSFDIADIKRQVEAHGSNLLLVSHLYGKHCPNLEELGAYCKSANISLLEDSAHLPWFFLQNHNQHSDVQFFTYRKLFAIPYGASSVVNAALHPAFSHYMLDHIKTISPQWGYAGFAKWLLREQAKRLIVASGVEWKRSYVELGDDPLKDFNQLPAPVKAQLGHLNTNNFAKIRRENCARLNEFFKSELPAWHVLDFDLAKDIPYQFLFFKREKIDFRTIINQFLSRGISMVKGLELPQATVDELGPAHPFNNQLCLPIHQDVGHAQIEHMIQACREILGRSQK